MSILIFFQIAPHSQASQDHFLYRRAIISTRQDDVQTCAALDAAVFTHASPALKDLRIFAGGTGQTELPYAITLSEPLQQDTDYARVLNLGVRAGHMVFDLEMPHRPYTTVVLDLDAHDFLATAKVSGSRILGDPNGTSLGTFTLFDLTSQHLSKGTSLPLSESTFPYLHIDLSLAPAPGTALPSSALNRADTLKSASVPPSREAQTLYSAIQQTSKVVQRGHETVANFQVSAKVPIERVVFVLAPGYKGNFSRPVRVKARVTSGGVTQGSNSESSEYRDSVAISQDGIGENRTHEDEGAASESVSGTILSIHKQERGQELIYERLALQTAIGANMQHAAGLEVTIDDGDDLPLPIASVQLQMRQRLICFSGEAIHPSLYYGDSILPAPVYDYAKLFQPVAKPLIATLAPETPNPAYIPRTDTRPFTERHPELLWIVLLAVVCILALIAFRSAKKLPR